MPPSLPFIHPTRDGSHTLQKYQGLFYFVGCSRDPIHDILHPCLSSRPPKKTTTMKRKELPESSDGDQQARPGVAGGKVKRKERTVLSLYSISDGGKLALNVVSGKKVVKELEGCVYPGAIVTFPPPPAPTSRRTPFLLPPYVQTVILAPALSAASSSPSTSSASTHASAATPEPTTMSILLATLEFPKDALPVRPVVLNESDERGRGFREVMETRIYTYETLEKGWDFDDDLSDEDH